MINLELKHPGLVGGELRYKHLLGRKFQMGGYDCYDLLRSVYKDNLNINLTNYARPNEWWVDESNLYVDNYQQEGFKLMDDDAELRPFDVLLIAIPDLRNRKKVITNHCAVYLCDGIIIHHRLGTLSSVEKYRGALRNLTTHHIRHKSVPDMRPTSTQTIDLMDRILPHKRDLLLGALNEHKNT